MAKQIETFSMSRLLVGAHYDFHNSVYNYIRTATAEALHVEAQATEYSELLNQQLVLINQNKKIAFTEELAELDRERDLWLGQLNTAVDSAAISPDATKAAAGKKLKNVLSPYRGIAGNEYTKQTSQVKGLLRDLGTDSMTDAIDALNLGATIQKLRQANNAFSAKYDERVTTEATRTRSDVTTDENRKAIDAVYQSIVQVVNAFAIAATTTAIDTFVDTVNARIDLAKGVVTRQRAGGTGNEKQTQKLQKTADKMGKALAKMEVSKAKYEADLAAYEKAKAEYEGLVNGE